MSRFVSADHPSRTAQVRPVRVDLRDLVFYLVMKATAPRNSLKQKENPHVQANQEFECQPRYVVDQDSVPLAEKLQLREDGAEEELVAVPGTVGSWGSDLLHQ